MVWYGMVWYGMVWYGMVWYGMVWYGMVWYGMVWYGMVWYGMVWYGMVWYGMVWYGMVWYGMVWYGMVWYGIATAIYAVYTILFLHTQIFLSKLNFGLITLVTKADNHVLPTLRKNTWGHIHLLISSMRHLQHPL